MSYATIQQELVSMQTNTAVNQSKNKTPSQELDGDAFLMLMLEQLKNQDPTNPMDNSEMLAQQAQFSQLQEMQELNETIANNNMIQQANSLVGKTVQVVDPNNPYRLITGLVTSANFTGDSATVTVNGKEYPLGLVAAVTDGAPASSADVIANKKLSELNNVSSLTEGYITLTTQKATSSQKENTYIKITKDMTVGDLQKEFEKAGVKSTIENGVLTISKGDYNTIAITNGKIGDSSATASNFVSAFQMFQNESGNLETAVLDFNRNGSNSSSNSSANSSSSSEQNVLERILNRV